MAGLALVLVIAVVAIASAGGGSPSGQASAGAGASSGSSHSRAHAHARGRRSGSAGRAGTTRDPSAPTVAALGPATGHPGTTTVPVLMYHVIAPPPAGAPFPGLYVTPQDFAAEMQGLHQAGWVAVTLDQLRANWTDGARLPAGKPVVITFDNGYRSQYTQALPVLRRMGWVADENIQLSGLPPSQGGLTDDQIRGLVKAGWELDTQGISHADLIRLGSTELHYQVATSREIIRRRFGVPVNWFCYPSGHYDATVIAAVRAAGYVGSTTVVPGWAGPTNDPYRLPRLRVFNGTTASGLLSQIASTQTATAPPAAYTGT